MSYGSDFESVGTKHVSGASPDSLPPSPHVGSEESDLYLELLYLESVTR